MSTQRLRRLRTKEIIRDHHISSQEELLKRLKDEGFSLTQATLSRDLKKMHITKITDADNTHRYCLTEDTRMNPLVNSRGLVSVEYSSKIVVVKTLPGYASPMAVLMDNNPSSFVKGTIAGRDTIFVALESGTKLDEFRKYLNEIIYKDDIAY